MLEHWQEQVLIFVDLGGPVIWAIMAVCFLLWALIIERYCFIRFIYPVKAQQYLQQWKQRGERKSWSAHRVREMLVSQANAQLSIFVSTIKTLIAICPLLGLLGTVTGMVGVFELIAIKGNSDAQAMASGIFRATIPTMAGLIVALSGLYFSSQLNQMVVDRTNKLSDQLTPDS